MLLRSRLRRQVLGFMPLAFVAAGCHSGHIKDAQVSDDGRVLVFRHDDTWSSESSIPYIADSAGVRSTRMKGRFALDPKGRWLLVFPERELLNFRLGDCLTLTRLDTRRCYQTRLPFDVTQDEINAAGRCAQPDSADSSSAAHSLQNFRLEVVFKDLPEIMIGPFPPEGRYWRWDAQANWADEWRCLGAEAATEQYTSRSAPRLIAAAVGTRKSPDCLTEMPSDGLSAFRTIWIRSDGSTVEIARKSDAPMWLASVLIVDIVAWPATLIEFALRPLCQLEIDLQPEDAPNQDPSPLAVIDSLLAGFVLGSLFHRQAAFADIIVFPDQLQQARETLRRKIDERRKAASAKDETHAVRDP